MRSKALAIAVFATAGLSAGTSSAQTIKPGLWEINNKMQSGNGELDAAMKEMQKQFANMPPEQRKMMEDAMAKRGMNMSAGPGGGISVKMCLTKEMVARNQMPMQQNGDCTQKRSPMVGNTMKVSFTCTKPPSSGEGTVVFNGDTGYKMNMKITSSARGKPETMTIDGDAKWLSNDCGNIKPLEQVAPPAK
jgi:hypothetical protein